MQIQLNKVSVFECQIISENIQNSKFFGYYKNLSILSSEDNTTEYKPEAITPGMSAILNIFRRVNALSALARNRATALQWSLENHRHRHKLALTVTSLFCDNASWKMCREKDSTCSTKPYQGKYTNFRHTYDSPWNELERPDKKWHQEL